MRIGRVVMPALQRLRASGVALIVLSLTFASDLSAGTVECPGDCDGDGRVRIDELVVGSQLALGTADTECDAIDANDDQSVSIDELVVAVGYALSGCPQVPTPTPGGLGTRRFSIDPASSPLLAVLRPDEVAANLPGFSGFLDLTAGEPDAKTGIAFVDVTGASEFISIDVAEQGTALCIKPIQEQIPVVRAGFVACDGGVAIGLRVRRDHRLGEVGHCVAGPQSGVECSADEDCGGQSCFTTDDCAAAAGRVEGAGESHPGVCNGPVRGEPLPADSGPGAVLILPDPVGGPTRGLPVEIADEEALPCGDEDAPGMTTEIALTSGSVEVEVTSLNNQPGASLTHEVSGENFSCASWQQEDGPGTLVLGLPNLDVPAVGDQLLDVITFFVWDD